LEAKELVRMVSNRGLRLLFSCPAISCEAIREASPIRTRIEISSATWRGSSERVTLEGPCNFYLLASVPYERNQDLYVIVHP